MASQGTKVVGRRRFASRDWQDVARLLRTAASLRPDEVVADLLGRACGLSFAEAASDHQVVDVAGVPVPVASPRTLIRTKQTARPSDLADVAFLEALIAGGRSE